MHMNGEHERYGCNIWFLVIFELKCKSFILMCNNMIILSEWANSHFEAMLEVCFGFFTSSM